MGLAQHRVAELWVATSQIVSSIESWILRHDKRQVHLRYKPDDQIRLLRLKVWATRHFISIEEVLDILVPSLRQTVKTKEYKGLGIYVATLTAKSAYNRLLRELEVRYGAGENIHTWRERERALQLALEKAEEDDGLAIRKTKYMTLLDAPDVESFLASYNKSIDSYRNEMEKASRQKWRRRKCYRNNPWL